MNPGRLEVCELMRFATPEEAGEVCACGHPSHEHKAGRGPAPSGEVGNPRPCACGCPDFRHRPGDLARWRAENARRRAPGRPEAPPGPLDDGPASRRVRAKRVPAETVPAAGGLL